jgi:hypothetical protein
MDSVFNDDAILRRYLLGELAPDEELKVEERLISDDNYIEQLEVIEDELIDNYARDDLNPQEREKFKKHFLVTPERRSKLHLANLLFRRVGEEAVVTAPPPGILERFRRSLVTFPLKPALSAALAIIVIGGSLLIVKVRQLQVRIAQLQAQQTTIAEQQTTGRNGKAAQTGQPPSPSIPLALTPSLVRDTGKIERLILPSSVSQVVLLLRLPANEYQSYRAVVFQIDERVEILTQEIATNVTIGGEKWVVFALPSSKLSIGDYQVKLSGAISKGEFEDIGKYPFQVRK